MSHEYPLSIVIATRNRQQYAVRAVSQIFHTAKSAQIVVRDNSDDDSLRQLIAEKRYSNRVKYSYIAQRISCVENYSLGIADSDGKYVCLIGDDDGVLDGIDSIVSVADSLNIAAVRPLSTVSYIWPGAFSDSQDGYLLISQNDRPVHFSSVKEQLRILFDNGCQDYLNLDLVKAYHGIVRRDYFSRIYDRTGSYCGGLATDIYLSVALSQMVEKVLCLDIPLTVGGACIGSASADAARELSIGMKEDAPHFVGQNYRWTDEVPEIYCDETIWADSAVHAVNEMGLGLYRVNQRALIAHCISKCLKYGKYAAYRDILVNHFLTHGGNMDEYHEIESEQRVGNSVYRVKRMIKRLGIRSKEIERIGPVHDILAAAEICGEIIGPKINDTVRNIQNCTA